MAVSAETHSEDVMTLRTTGLLGELLLPEFQLAS
jgi:hypothetical protein